MDELTLHAAKRDILGKKVRFLRREGVTPVHLFGHSIESRALQCDTTQLKSLIARAGFTKPINLKIDQEKQPKNVLIKEIQRSVLNKELLHVDFYQMRKGETVRVEIPIILVGEAPALKSKGRMLTHGMTSLHIECLPENIPPQIEIDLSQLEEVDQVVSVKDIVLDPAVTVHADPEQLVVKVSEVGVMKEEEVEAEVVEAAEEEAEKPAEESEQEES